MSVASHRRINNTQLSFFRMLPSHKVHGRIIICGCDLFACRRSLIETLGLMVVAALILLCPNADQSIVSLEASCRKVVEQHFDRKYSTPRIPLEDALHSSMITCMPMPDALVCPPRNSTLAFLLSNFHHN